MFERVRVSVHAAEAGALSWVLGPPETLPVEKEPIYEELVLLVTLLWCLGGLGRVAVKQGSAELLVVWPGLD